MSTPIALLASLAALAASPTADGSADYLRAVKPILARHCVGCHGSTKPRAGLRLDTAAGAIKGGRGGPSVVPGDAEESPLFLSILGEGAGEQMPLRKPPLSEPEIEQIRAWIDAGAAAPKDEVPTEAAPTHWAFVAPQRPEIPEVEAPGPIDSPIDRFIRARLDREGIAPSPEADPVTLIRRVSLDLIGLPPTPEEVDAFLKDEAPDAYERLVDRLLASPHYGERWARPWLDLARYADSNGYSIDAPRSIWKYRDWVIDALNRDLPFDRFATEQLAADLRPDATPEQLVATGFHRNTPINQEGGIDREQFRVESIIDRANTTATTFLGLTMGCCQCHDHKYDPITQEEYFQHFAFFNNSDEPEIPVASPEQIAERDAVEARAKTYVDRLLADDPAILEAQRAWEQGLDMAARQKQTEAVREAIDLPFDGRDPARNRVAFEAFLNQAPAGRAHKKAIAAIRAKAPKLVTTMVVRERRSNPRKTHLLLGGDFTRPGQEVSPGVPSVLPPLESADGSPDRMDLANWLFRDDHPLTARVAVNRIWQAHFGRGLVATDDDFGTQGEPPSHPELLDWLATEFRRLGWSQKAMHRLIVTSATYRQSSMARPDLAAVDPNNRLLARQSRLRLEAELIRDSALTASGLLARAMHGPGVYPPQPEGVMGLGQVRRVWKEDTGPDRYRRGLYTFIWRATPHPLLTVFDAPDATRACTRRERSNTPLQALTLLNDRGFFECAEALADRLDQDGDGDGSAEDQDRLTRAFRRCLSREPSPSERERLLDLLAEIRAEPGTTDREAWTTLARVLLNLDEFITRE